MLYTVDTPFNRYHLSLRSVRFLGILQAATDGMVSALCTARERCRDLLGKTAGEQEHLAKLVWSK